ncbi:MAG: YaeQ family protein, partial [Myxococcales bacterium]|nr:YaeQ family protein [Myxococcales bacterium]
QHPSESDRYVVARVIARALEHAEGLDFSKGGVATGDEPALLQRNLQGDLTAWIEVGSPSLDRLHKASKTGARVVLYGWKGLEALAGEVAGAVHRAEQLELRGLEQSFLDAVAATLDRNNTWSLAVSGGALYLEVAGELHEGSVSRVPIPGLASRVAVRSDW